MADGEAEFRRRVQKKFADNINRHLYGDNTEEEEKKVRALSKPDSPYSIQNVLWLITAMAVFYLTDFYVAVRFDDRIKRTWFNVGGILIAINIGIAIFLIVWLTYIKKVKSDDWERLYPAAIPIATASFALGAFCVTVGLWPVWNIFTPVILFTLFMGVVVTIALIPGL